MARTTKSIQESTYETVVKKERATKIFNPSNLRTPTRTIKSIGAMKIRVEQFFDKEYIPKDAIDKKNTRITPNDFALWLGYTSIGSLTKSISAFKDEDPYKQWIEFALGQIEDGFLKTWIQKVEECKSFKALDNYEKILNRMDKYSYKEEKSNNISVTINVAKEERIDNALEKSIGTLTSSLKNLEEASYQEVEEAPEILLINEEINDRGN